MNKEKEEKLRVNLIIILSIALIISSLTYIISNIKEAKDYCNLINEEYKLIKFQHTCNNQIIVKTTDYGWIKESEIPNFNIKIK